MRKASWKGFEARQWVTEKASFFGKVGVDAREVEGDWVAGVPMGKPVWPEAVSGTHPQAYPHSASGKSRVARVFTVVVVLRFTLLYPGNEGRVGTSSTSVFWRISTNTSRVFKRW
jgi:hypothetical protein